MNGHPRILLISGSIRQPSYTAALAQHVEEELRLGGAETRLWDLRREPLPIADPAYHQDPSQHPDNRVRSFVQEAVLSHAFVLASPIYHNSYSGVLKNALDHLTIAHFTYKPVGLISHGGNRSPQAVDHLRIVVRGLLGVATPTQVCTAAEDYRETEPGIWAVSSPAILTRAERFSTELIAFAERLQAPD
jgi:azobenzene reductase